ncbi:MAG: hypothetical protein LBC06_00455 [Rickettsiales bacterium]|jgi:hypothetical protein|nr:hypothetical protein [Rickettsiales bacterium]
MLNLEQQNNTALSPEDLLKHMQSLEKRIKSLEVTNRVILGLFIGTLAAAMTVGAGFAIAAAPIIAGSIVGGILATVALAALGVTAYKYRAEIKAGFKYAAEKTVEGAEYTARKIKAGAVRAKNSVKEGYENSVDSLKRGAHLVNKRTREKASNVLTAAADKLYRAAGNENYSDKIDNELIPDSPQKNKIQEIKENLKAILVDGEDNTKLFESIRLGISSKIGEKIAGETYLDFRDYLPNEQVDRWKKQKSFVDNLDANDLRNLVEKRLSDKSKYFRDSIFSEHYDEIKEIIREHKIEHKLSNVVEELSDVAGKYGRRVSSTQSTSPSLPRSSSTSSLNFVSTNSTNNIPVAPKVSGNPRTGDATVAPPKAPKSPISSRDSGRDSPNPSGFSTPTGRQSPSLKEALNTEFAREWEEWKQQPPSTRVLRQKFVKVNPPYYREPSAPTLS